MAFEKVFLHLKGRNIDLRVSRFLKSNFLGRHLKKFREPLHKRIHISEPISDDLMSILRSDFCLF